MKTGRHAERGMKNKAGSAMNLARVKQGAWEGRREGWQAGKGKAHRHDSTRRAGQGMGRQTDRAGHGTGGTAGRAARAGQGG
jgi:hypothetical protein